MNKSIHIISGGTNFYLRPHLAISAPSFGNAGTVLQDICRFKQTNLDVIHHRTRMAGGPSWLDTNEDVANLIERIVVDNSSKIVFMPVALCDYTGTIGGRAGKNLPRLDSKLSPNLEIKIKAADKIISNVRKNRKDIFAVGFKTTSGNTEDEQYIAGLNLLKQSSLNLVLANDTVSKLNMIITPEEARYHVTDNRLEALTNLVDMALLRSHLTFTRSTVVSGDSVDWNSELVPSSLRTIVNYCISRGAYKPFRGATVGHFAAQISSDTFITSKRKTNFNDIEKTGLVLVKTDGPDSVISYGSKPSVGGQSQRIIFKEHEGMDCIVHFHCPIQPSSKVPIVSQREFECGSHQCGQNTSNGLKRFGNLLAVYLDNHGPNIVFNRSINPTEVINFIEDNFNLKDKTGGYVTLPFS